MANPLIAALTSAARDLGSVEAETDPRDHMPAGDVKDRVIAAEKALDALIDTLQAECAMHRRALAAEIRASAP